MRSFLRVLGPGLLVGEAGAEAPACVRHHRCCFEAFPEELGTLATKLCASSSDRMSFVSMTSVETESRSLKHVGRYIP